jgi:hypothetical protein
MKELHRTVNPSIATMTRSEGRPDRADITLVFRACRPARQP